MMDWLHSEIPDFNARFLADIKAAVQEDPGGASVMFGCSPTLVKHLLALSMPDLIKLGKTPVSIVGLRQPVVMALSSSDPTRELQMLTRLYAERAEFVGEAATK